MSRTAFGLVRRRAERILVITGVAFTLAVSAALAKPPPWSHAGGNHNGAAGHKVAAHAAGHKVAAHAAGHKVG